MRIAVATGDIPQNVNFALKASLVRMFLDTRNVDYETAQSTTHLEPADIAERARNFTIAVECWR